jgi:MATE family multidrug resistance protein
MPWLRDEFRSTLRLALPLVIAEVGWMSMGIVDTIMVGRLPESAIAIGATGLGQSLYHSIAIFGSGLLLGMDTFVSHAFGREDIEDARHTLVNGLVMALLLTPILMIAVSFWPALMHRFGVSPELVEPMRPFLFALNWGTLPLVSYFALRRYLQAVNVVHPVMFALISANAVNAVGDWVLIYGHLGLRPMGITGSGWSTCIARVYMALVLLITVLYVESKRDIPHWMLALRVDAQRMWSLLRLGAPAAAQIACEIGAFSGATALIAKLGPVPLSGHEIALNCAALTFMVPLGISSAAAVRVGQNLGRKDPVGARRAGWSAIALGCGFMNDRSPILSRPSGHHRRRNSAADCRRIPTVRWPANSRDRRSARHRRHSYPHARQSSCVLVHRAAARIRSLLSVALGRTRHLDWTLSGVDHHWFGAADCMASSIEARQSEAVRLTRN